MDCKYCFARFDGNRLPNKLLISGAPSRTPEISLGEHIKIIEALATCFHKNGGIQALGARINFVGGEGTIHPYLPTMIQKARELGFSISIVTNGYKFATKGVPDYLCEGDIVGISIDSVDPTTNSNIGRKTKKGVTLSTDSYLRIRDDLRSRGISIKINTTVCRYNAHESMAEFIDSMAPERWKIFQALPVDDQNGHNRLDWEISQAEFQAYVERARKSSIKPNIEDNNLMRGSYCMISPKGCFFDNVSGSLKYSDPILEIGIEKAWEQADFSPERFAARTES